MPDQNEPQSQPMDDKPKETGNISDIPLKKALDLWRQWLEFMTAPSAELFSDRHNRLKEIRLIFEDESQMEQLAFLDAKKRGMLLLLINYADLSLGTFGGQTEYEMKLAKAKIAREERERIKEERRVAREERRVAKEEKRKAAEKREKDKITRAKKKGKESVKR